MLRVLHLCYKVPFPPRDGYDVRVINLLDHLSKENDITLLCRVLAPMSNDQKDTFIKKSIQLETIFIQKPSLLRKLSKGLLFLSSRFPLASAGWYFEALSEKLSCLLASQQWDVVIVDGSWLGVYWPLIQRAGITTLVVFHNLEYELLQRIAKIMSFSLKKIIYLHDAFKMKLIEERLVSQANLSIVTSDRERVLLLKKCPGLNVAVVPNCVDTESLKPLANSTEENILFVGSLDYLPNQDAVMYFVREILPSVYAEVRNITFTIAGRGAPKKIKKLSDQSRVFVFSDVSDLQQYYRTSLLCVAPLRCGGGTRLKILEAMAYGRPIVSTSVGCEGLLVENNRNIIIADTALKFSKAIGLLLQKPELRERLAREARYLVEKRYSRAKVGSHYAGLVEKLVLHNHEVK
jgi:glycosyltransferase involved in cell wall biosynthesis